MPARTNTAATVQRRVLMRPLPQFGTINEQLVPIGYGNYSSIQVVVGEAAVARRPAAGRLHRLAHDRGALAAQPGRGALRAAHVHAPAARAAAERRLDDAVVLGRATGRCGTSSGGWHDQHRHVLPIGRAGRHAGQRRSDRRSGPEQPDDGAVVQYLHAHHGGRAADLRERLPSSRRSRSAPRTRSTRPAPGSKASCSDEPFYIDFSFFKNIRLNARVNFQMRVEMFNATNVVQWGGPNTNVTNTAFGTITENAGQRSAVGAAAVPHQLLNVGTATEKAEVRIFPCPFSRFRCQRHISRRGPPGPE